MTRQIPDGNTLRPLLDVAADLRNGIDIWPADADERRIDDFLRRTRARPMPPSSGPRLAFTLFLVVAFAAGAGLAVLATALLT